jgi:hypothetical protein
MLIALLAAAQVAPAPPAPILRRPPPQPVVSTMTAPPSVYINRIGDGQPARFTVDVEVRGGDAVLWSGPLRVGGGYGQTSIRREQTEPGDTECRPGRGVAPISTSLNLTLNGRGEQDQVLVNVRWSRPGDQPCAPGPNTRTVELAGTVELPANGAATLTGDGGLIVRIRRR